MVPERVPRELRGIDLPRGPDAELDHFHYAADPPRGEYEAKVLVRFLGPAVEVVADGALPRVHEVLLLRVDQAFVEVRGVVTAGHHHAAHAFFHRELVNVERHVHVRPLRVITGRREAALAAGGMDVGQVHHRIHAAEQLPVRLQVRRGQVRHSQPFHRVAVPVGGASIHQRAVVLCPQRGQHLRGDVAARPGHQHPSLPHRPPHRSLFFLVSIGRPAGRVRPAGPRCSRRPASPCPRA